MLYEVITASTFPTINDLFDAIQNCISKKANTIRVSYDSVNKIPKSIYIDFDKNVYDEEYSVVISNFNEL